MSHWDMGYVGVQNFLDFLLSNTFLFGSFFFLSFFSVLFFRTSVVCMGSLFCVEGIR